MTAFVLSMLSAVSKLDTLQALLVLRLPCIGVLAFAAGEACMLRSVCSCFVKRKRCNLAYCHLQCLQGGLARSGCSHSA